MRNDLRRPAISIGLVAALSLLPAAAVRAQTPGCQAPPCAFPPLAYSEYHDAFDPAPYEILVPENWADSDYTLLVDQHGYNSPDPANPASFPPLESDIGTDENGCCLLSVLLQQGYAVAGSSYRVNGWAVLQGFQDTEALVALVKAKFTPKRTIFLGCSMGTVVTFKLLEDCSSCADGAILSGDFPGGGPPNDRGIWDFTLAGMLAWDVAFHDKDGGWDEQNWGPFANPKPGLLYCARGRTGGCVPSDPGAKFNAEIADPTNFGRFEFIRLVTGLKNPYFDETQWINGWFQFIPAYIGTEGFARLKRRIEIDTGLSVPGPVAENLTHQYALAPDDVAYLATLGVDAPALLDAMNSRRYTRDPVAEQYLTNYFAPAGEITKPVITFKDVGDPLALNENDYYYHETLKDAGTDGLLLQLFRAEMNHCGERTDQVIAAIEAMRAWILFLESGGTEGRVPQAADFEPANPVVGDFVPFTPGPYPFLPGG
jgi:hypothetical protein